MQNAAKLAAEAHACVWAVRESLRNPDAAALTQSWPLLQVAIDRLRELQPLLNEPGGVRNDALRQSVIQLQREVALAAALLESSARFAVGWSRCLSAGVSSYTPGGAPPLPVAGRQVVLEG